jgi:hypothetical protein
MTDRLVVAVLGNRNAGKSLTWNTLFGRTVRTGKDLRLLQLNARDAVEVFLVSGSPEERNEYGGDLVGPSGAVIVLCSMQYTASVMQTIDFFSEQGFLVFLHWLNPGYRDISAYPDSLEVYAAIQHRHSLTGIRNGKINPAPRVRELRDFIYGWASSRKLLVPI